MTQSCAMDFTFSRDPAWLDREYNNRALVPEHARHFEQWAQASAAARARGPALLDLSYGHGPGEQLDIWSAVFGPRGKDGYFEPLFASTGDVKWVHTNEFICGDRAVTEWHRTATLATGERQEWLGCDLYTFRRGLIVMKDTYIKVVV